MHVAHGYCGPVAPANGEVVGRRMPLVAQELSPLEMRILELCKPGLLRRKSRYYMVGVVGYVFDHHLCQSDLRKFHDRSLYYSGPYQYQKITS